LKDDFLSGEPIAKRRIYTGARPWHKVRVNLSVIIPAHNKAASLDRLLKSLDLSHMKTPDECVVVDDGSVPAQRDEIKRIVTRLAGEGVPIRRVRHETARGVCGARNAGVQAASGSLLCFFDHDMCVAPGYLERCREIHEAHPEILVLNGLSEPGRNDIYSRYWHYYYAAAFNRPHSGPFYTIDRISPGVLSVKRALLERVHPLWDESLTTREDFDLWLRLRALEIPVYKCDELIGRHFGPETLRAFVYQRNWYARAEIQLRRKYGTTTELLAEEARLIPPDRLEFFPLKLAARIGRFFDPDLRRGRVT
jgi:glycosyltransferase involved in cell wall biosynthesis